MGFLYIHVSEYASRDCVLMAERAPIECSDFRDPQQRDGDLQCTTYQLLTSSTSIMVIIEFLLVLNFQASPLLVFRSMLAETEVLI